MIKKTTLRVSALSIALFLIIASAFTAFAAEDTATTGKTHALVDSAAVFTDEQTSDLVSQMKSAGEKTGWQFIIYTNKNNVPSSKMESAADSFYKNGGYEKNAIILVMDMGSKQRIMRMKGDVKGYFANDNSRYEDIISAMKPYLNKGDMYGAAKQFVSKSLDVYKMGKTNKLLIVLKKYGIIIGLVSVAIGVILFFVIKSKYKNMGKSGTYDLAANSSANLEDVEDTFVTQHTTVRTIQKNNNSSGSSNHSDGSGSRTF